MTTPITMMTNAIQLTNHHLMTTTNYHEPKQGKEELSKKIRRNGFVFSRMVFSNDKEKKKEIEKSNFGIIKKINSVDEI